MAVDRRSTLALGAVLILATHCPAFALGEGPAASANDGRHDFDFLIGNWTVRHVSLRTLPDGRTSWVETTGTCAMRTILGGIGNVDENVIAASRGSYQGMTLRLFDPASKRWSIYWIDSRAPGIIGPAAYGSFANGVGTFVGDEDLDGQPIRVRLVWSEIAAASCRWQQAYSRDGEKTWETNWTMNFERV